MKTESYHLTELPTEISTTVQEFADHFITKEPFKSLGVMVKIVDTEVMEGRFKQSYKPTRFGLLVGVPLVLFLRESQGRIPFNQIPLWLNSTGISQLDKDVLKLRLTNGDVC